MSRTRPTVVSSLQTEVDGVSLAMRFQGAFPRPTVAASIRQSRSPQVGTVETRHFHSSSRVEPIFRLPSATGVPTRWVSRDWRARGAFRQEVKALSYATFGTST